MINPEIDQGGANYLEIPNIKRYHRVRRNLGRLMNVLDIRIEGQETLQRESSLDRGTILAPTHVSWWDIIALGAANDAEKGGHTMRFMGKDVIWKFPYIGGLARDAGAYSVNRSDSDSRQSALDTTVDLLNQDEWAVIYPEGTRNRSFDRRSLGELKTGVPRAALSAEGITPIIPIGVGYREGFIRKRASTFHIGVVIGEPLYVDQAEPSPDQVDVVNSRLADELLVLKNLAVDLAES